MTAGTAAAPFSSVLEFAPMRTAVACARLHAVAVLQERGVASDVVDDAAVVVSELITNACAASAVLPERPPVTLRLTVAEAAVTIEAWDSSPLDPEVHDPGEDDEAGRGLTIVAAIAARWGVERTGYRRKSVWVVLARDVPGP